MLNITASTTKRYDELYLDLARRLPPYIAHKNRFVLDCFLFVFFLGGVFFFPFHYYLQRVQVSLKNRTNRHTKRKARK